MVGGMASIKVAAIGKGSAEVLEVARKPTASKTLTGRDISIAKTEETKFHVSFYLGLNCIDILILKQGNLLVT